MNWKENKLGAISLVFALLPILVIALVFSGFNAFIFGSTVTIVLTGLIFSSPILAIGFAIYSSEKKEKEQILGKISLTIGSIFVLLFLVAIIFIQPPVPPPRYLVGESADALEDAYANKSKLVTTQQVTFTQSNDTLARLAIVEAAGVGIEKKQICLSLGDYAGVDGQGGFTGGVDGENPNENRIRFEGGGTRDVKISVICYQGEKLPDLFGEDGIYEDISPEWAEDCECVTDSELKEQTCCLVALRISR